MRLVRKAVVVEGTWWSQGSSWGKYR